MRTSKMADLVVVFFAWQPRKAWLRVTTRLQSRRFCRRDIWPYLLVMQTVLDFGPVLFSRSSKYCLWLSSKLFSSSSGFSNCSTVSQTPREVAKWMGKHAPVFAVNGNDISVLREPTQFFNTLKVRSLNNVMS